MDGLNDKQQRFVEEYLKDFNGKQSAIRAGYAEGSAESTASRLLRNGKVKAAIEKKKDKTTRRIDLTVEMVLQQYMKIAFGDAKDIATWTQNGIVQLNDPDNVDGTIIDSIEPTEHGVKIKRSDRMRALEMLAKYTGMLDEKPQTNVDVTQYINALSGSVRSVWGDEVGEKER